MTSDSYLRYPHISGDSIVFVAENDIWLTDRDGGRAFRVSADHAPARSPRLSPDGALVAWTADRDGAFEVYAAPADGGISRRLTFWGQQKTLVRGWLSDTEVLVVSTTGQAERQRAFAHAVPVDGSPSRRLPYGWIDDIALGPDGGVLLSTSTTVEPAWWKRYRGGTAAQLWLDLNGDGDFKRVFADLPSSLVSPLWTLGSDGRQRIGFVSDHEDRGRVYSAPVGKRAPTVSRLVRHSDGEFYARHAASDGRSVVYVAGGSLYLLDSLATDATGREVDVRLGGPRTSQQPMTVKAAGKLGTISPDPTGRASAVETRGSVHWLTHREGPVRALGDGSGVRRRQPVVLGGTKRVAWVSDSSGDDAIEVIGTDDVDAAPAVLVPAGRVGRVLELAASPDGRTLAIASHDNTLRLVNVPAGGIGRSARLRVVDEAEGGDMQGLAFSPDSRWLAWSAPGIEPLRHIRMVEVAGRGKPFDVTPLRFTDTAPVFTADGKHLAFLSVRSLDPVYDSFVFDLSFPNGCRPYLVPLAADVPSPFDPQLGGRPVGDGASGRASGDEGEQAVAPADATDAEPTRVDPERLDQRLVPFPVPGGHYEQLRAVKGGLVWLNSPLQGALGDDRARVEDEPARAKLEHIDLATGKIQELAETADRVEVSGDGLRLVIVDKDEVRVVPSSRKTEKEDPDVVKVDLQRVRVEVQPQAEWRQMFGESWRLMRDHYWRPDMKGVDWTGVADRYRPLLDRLGSHDDLVDLLWEMNGELGTSHAYVNPPPSQGDESRRQGLLGADVEYADGVWRVARIVPGESSEPRARSPLTAPGVAAQVGEAIVAVDGRATTRSASPGSLLVGTAGKPVELTLAPRSGGSPRRVVVVPLADEMPLRYQDWVNDRREYVHGRTDGAVGYVHVPDMVSGGWAQLHRDLRTEVGRDALIVDVRANRGGHTSQLVLEKLARKIIGWDRSRGYQPESYPGDARRGPMVTVTDAYAGSDGDIITAAIRALELGPVVGTRTWGGVVGIDGRYTLVDGTSVTQPRFAFWFEKFGWGVENYGVDPDIEVVAAPHDRVANRDTQLDYALTLVQQLLRKTPAKQPPPLPPL
ncbi:MAG: tricorn protease [Nocardioidaceae bacterium]|nr:tricorn protease [Nocardioidaceae bacterium]